jgi:hypothetical protein
MSEQTEQKTAEAASSEVKDSSLEKRRRLIKAGLGAAPVLMTVVNRSAFATGLRGGKCTTPSAYGSINTSRQDKTYSCTGRTPGYWKQSQKFYEWPTPYYPTTVGGWGGHKATLFGASIAFGAVMSTFNGSTLLAVLDSGGNDDNTALARHIVAALLNAASGKTSAVLSVSAVQNIWKEFITKGYFEPTAGVKWNAAQITAYLVTTMPV